MAHGNENERADATIEDVAAHFGVSVRTVHRWLKSTDLPHRRVGGTVRFNLGEVDDWSARGGRPAEDPSEAPAEKGAA